MKDNSSHNNLTSNGAKDKIIFGTNHDNSLSPIPCSNQTKLYQHCLNHLSDTLKKTNENDLLLSDKIDKKEDDFIEPGYNYDEESELGVLMNLVQSPVFNFFQSDLSSNQSNNFIPKHWPLKNRQIIFKSLLNCTLNMKSKMKPLNPNLNNDYYYCSVVSCLID